MTSKSIVCPDLRFAHDAIFSSISFYRREYLLKFDDKFEVQDDFEVLKRMGLLLGNLQAAAVKLIFH